MLKAFVEELGHEYGDLLRGSSCKIEGDKSLFIELLRQRKWRRRKYRGRKLIMMRKNMMREKMMIVVGRPEDGTSDSYID
jgi:hypothetical protein